VLAATLLTGCSDLLRCFARDLGRIGAPTPPEAETGADGLPRDTPDTKPLLPNAELVSLWLLYFPTEEGSAFDEFDNRNCLALDSWSPPPFRLGAIGKTADDLLPLT